MRNLSRLLWWISLLAADAAILARALTSAASLAGVRGALAVHAGLALVMGASLVLFAPPLARRTPRALAALTVALALFVPVIGPAGLVVALALWLDPARVQRSEPWVTLDLDLDRDSDDAHARPIAGKRRAVAASTIATVLRDRSPETAERRFQAILRVRHLPPKAGVALLKLALKDPSDEVRLFAFARIERMRDDLEKDIGRLVNAIGAAGDDEIELARLHVGLAESYSEIAYLGLAEGVVLEHALDNALAHADRVCALRPAQAPPHYLRGRILLRKGESAAARAAFDDAAARGYPRTKVLPYLAECAFRERRLDAVRAALRELDSSVTGHAALQPVLEFWR